MCHEQGTSVQLVASRLLFYRYTITHWCYVPNQQYNKSESFTRSVQMQWKGEQDSVNEQLLQATRYGHGVFHNICTRCYWYHVIVANPGYVVGLQSTVQMWYTAHYCNHLAQTTNTHTCTCIYMQLWLQQIFWGITKTQYYNSTIIHVQQLHFYER